MSQSHRAILTYADEISADLRQQLEKALQALEIEFAPEDANDETSDAGVVPLYVAASRTEQFTAASHPRAVRILISTDNERPPKDWLPIRQDEIGAPTRAWLNILQPLGKHLQRPGLAAYAEAAGNHDRLTECAQRYPHDPLAMPIRAAQSPAHLRAELESAIERAKAAEASAIERDDARKKAEHTASTANRRATADRNEADILRQKLSILESQLEDSLWSPHQLNGEARRLVEAARQAVWRARVAAADAETAAQSIANPLLWPNSAQQTRHPARYVGEHENAVPSGHGVIEFLNCGSKYIGQFEDGARHGFGVGIDASRRTWIGQWKNDEPHGFGALELADGARLEGEVRPPAPNKPALRNLHAWPAPGQTQSPKPRRLHSEAPRQLPSPDSQPSRLN